MNFPKTTSPLFLLFFVLLFSCKDKVPNNKAFEFESFVTFKYAKGITITKTTQGNIVTILNPQSGEILDHFVVTKDSVTNLENTKTIRLPIGNIIAYSSTYISFIEKFDKLKNVKGVTYSQGIKNKTINKQLVNKQTIDIGSEQSPDKELILSLKPNITLIYPSNGSNDWYKSFDVPTITNVEYLEIHPLAQAEWIKLYGILFDKEKLADSIFNSIETNYLELIKSLNKDSNLVKPTVLCGELFDGVWTLPGGKSTTSQIIKDAGGNYFYKKDTSVGSKKIDFEVILKQDSTIDYWVLLSYDNQEITKKYLLEKNERYSYLSVLKTNKIGVCNTAKNTYFEKGILEPHVLLSDLIYLFHKKKPFDFPEISGQAAQDKNIDSTIYFKAITE